MLVRVNKAAIERAGRQIQANWEKYEANNLLLETEDPGWSGERQAIYKSLQGTPRAKLAERFMELELAATIAHEAAHVSDLVDLRFSLKDSEVRAYLKQFTEHPIALHDVEACLDPSMKNLPAHYPEAARVILSCLTQQSTATTHRALYRLPPESLTRAARKCLSIQNSTQKKVTASRQRSP
ncbi:hypothetical protein ACFL2T_00700 [Elusimicrobiota bacterium]